jgi:ComF family protein
LPQGAQQCGICLRHPPPLTRCTAFTDYAYPWDQCIARLKFQDEPAWAAVLAKLMTNNPCTTQLLEQADGIIGIPLAPERLQERGYNQSALIARHLAPGKTQERTLLRIRHDPPQSQVSRLARLRQLRHAFLVEPTLVQSVQGKHWVLIDDVMTTGATLFEAARTLLQAGARRVDAAVFARTPHE